MGKPTQDKKIEIPDSVLKKLLTVSEIRMLKNRWKILQHLEEGLSIRNIAERVQVGTDTVVRVSKMMDRKHMKNNSEKADNKIEKFKSNTPWIFGKND